MRTILQKDKRAISNMVSYVLLIVITLSTAAGVYAFLKFKAQVPTDDATCEVDVSMTIKNYECEPGNSKIIIRLENSGFFNIDGFFIKGANDPDKVPIAQLRRTDISSNESSDGIYYFTYYDKNKELKGEPFSPRESITAEFSYSKAIKEMGDELAKVEIQPFVYSGERIAACPDTLTFKTKPGECGSVYVEPTEEEIP